MPNHDPVKTPEVNKISNQGFTKLQWNQVIYHLFIQEKLFRLLVSFTRETSELGLLSLTLLS